ncbi:MAG: transporter substrate-binding domain-containing protein [Abitibacteriaceae bacterium]|nr:transporter substrate-binding domain-containing protein [Abditibacteriaceae bacterium]
MLFISLNLVRVQAQTVTSAASSTQASTPLSSRPLRVATRLIPPFVVQEQGSLTGFSTELWQSIAKQLKLKSKTSVSPTMPDLLAQVKSGRADLGIAAISITADRDKDFDFSQPIYDSGLQILVRDQSSGSNTMPGILTLLLSPIMLQFAGIILLLSLVMAHVVWFLERNHPQGIIENKAYFPGIFKALWWSAGTLGAQADEMPKSGVGRFIAIVWMFTGIAFVAYFTAAVTSSLTVQQLQGDIRGPDDLPGKRVATTQGSTSAQYLHGHGVQVQEVTQITQAYEALLKKQVDAVVFDAPVLLYYAAHEGSGKVQVIGSVFRKEDYGIIFQQNSPYRKSVNNALLALKENGTYDKLYNKWFGDKS